MSFLRPFDLITPMTYDFMENFCLCFSAGFRPWPFSLMSLGTI